MSRISSNLIRTTNMLSSDRLLAQLQRTQQQLFQQQEALATGKTINRPSDAPARVSAVMVLQQAMAARVQHERNLGHSSMMLNNADAALADATEIVREAQSIASSQIGIGSSAETRKAQAGVIDAQIQALIDIGNRKIQGVPLFGGNLGSSGPAFTSFLGGIRYNGSTGNVSGDVGLDNPLGFNSNGADAYGALSSRVVSEIDLNPQPSAQTRLRDVNGATGEGVRAGSLRISVNGVDAVVDLTHAETLGDVTTRVNQAIADLGGTGALAVAGDGFELTAGAGETISINEVGTGATAGDLGIVLTAGPGATVAGDSVETRLSASTQLADLGIAIDFTSGLKITHGGVTKVADFSGAQTVQDMANVVDRLNLGLRLQINQAGTGVDLISEVSGISLSIGENGGTTAGDLGLRTLGVDTKLDDFRFGAGVGIAEGDDFEVRLHDGRSFRVDLSGGTTVQDVLTRIGDAATAAGITIGAPGDGGTDFNLGLASDGNGFVLEDQTAGGDDFRVVQLGQSLAAEHLGIYANAGSATRIEGDDQAQVRVESVLTNLMMLRDSLLSDDVSGITLAGTAIEQDVNTLTQARAEVGVRAQRAEQQLERSQTLGIADASLLSDISEADITEVITRFTQLQQQLDATLRMGAQQLQLSLLDFLRL